MGKIKLIIWREYYTKIRNKAFIIMTILGPLLVTGFITLVVWLPNAKMSQEKVLVVDESFALTLSKPSDTKLVKFEFTEETFDQARKRFYNSGYTIILHVPKNVIMGGNTIQVFYKKNPGLAVVNYMKLELEKKLYEFKLSANNINPEIIKNANVHLNVNTLKLNESGNSEDTRLANVTVVGLGIGVLIFIFVMIYGMMVMRSVMEEKNNRIVEIIVSSVKPFQLMLGKIIGVALVGVTQFVVWIIVTSVLTTAASTFFLNKIVEDTQTLNDQKEVVYKQGSNANFKEFKQTDTDIEAIKQLNDFSTINIPQVVFFFFLFFIGGYLLYSSMFAAIGSAIDSETDTNQFMMPLMLPQLAAYLINFSMLTNPESDLIFWSSFIPFTSPTIMMARLPLGVPLWQVVVSLVLLYGTFIFTTWLAGKIYRTGILMYGKKVTWREIGKWIFYKA